jgi:hypothetical protein
MPWGDKDSLSALQRRLDVDMLITGMNIVCRGGEAGSSCEGHVLLPGRASLAYHKAVWVGTTTARACFIPLLTLAGAAAEAVMPSAMCLFVRSLLHKDH